MHTTALIGRKERKEYKTKWNSASSLSLKLSGNVAAQRKPQPNTPSFHATRWIGGAFAI
jgi:hypothetical protein